MLISSKIKEYFKTFHNIDASRIIFGRVPQNNLLAIEKVFDGAMVRYVAFASSKDRFAVVDTNL